MRESLYAIVHRLYVQNTCERLEKTSSKLFLMFCAVLVSKDRRAEHGGGIVTKTSNKRLDEEYEDTYG